MFDGRVNKGVGFAETRKYTTHANYTLELHHKGPVARLMNVPRSSRRSESK